MLTPRNGFVVCSIIEKSNFRVGGIIVPTNSDTYTEAMVVSVPASGTATVDLKVGQIVWLEWKRLVKGPEGPKPILAGLPFKQGKHEYLIFEESQILGIIAQDITEYAESQKANSLAATEAKLLA